MNRGYHHTFNYCPEKKIQLVLSFVRVYDQKLDAYLSKEGRLNTDNHSDLEIEFHHEKEVGEFDTHILQIEENLKICLRQIVPFESPVVTAIPQLKNLVESINQADPSKIKSLLSYGRTEVWEERFKELSCFFDDQ